MENKINFRNKTFSKKVLKEVIYEAFTNFGISKTTQLADEIKEIGFHHATRAGISLSIEDLKVPPTKKTLILKSNSEIARSEITYIRGEINSVERFQKVIDTWNKASEALKNDVVHFYKTTDPLNPIYLMAFSGARGNLSQVRQLVGMRGLMSDPNGQIIDIPITQNFREGLTVTDYIISAYGARKGVVDTALRTADSGYLTRRLVDVAQDVIVRAKDCGTKHFIDCFFKNDEEDPSSSILKLVGRTSASTYRTKYGKIIVSKNEQITTQMANEIINEEITHIRIRSPLICELTRSTCQNCYGWDLAQCKRIKIGEAVGIIAAQSIGEPGTQLTMRTFHTGGVFTSDPNLQIHAKKTGIFRFSKFASENTKQTRTAYGSSVHFLERDAEFYIENSREILIRFQIPAKSSIFVENGSFIKVNDLIADLPIKNQQTVDSRRNLYATASGEISILGDSKQAWILEGDVYNIPPQSLVNKFKYQQMLNEEDAFTNLKIKTNCNGFIKLEKGKTHDQIRDIKIQKGLNSLELPICRDKKTKQLLLFSGQDFPYIIHTLPQKIEEKPCMLATQIENKYVTITTGLLFYTQNDTTNVKGTIIKNQKILFIPEENHFPMIKKGEFKQQKSSEIKNTGAQLTNNIFARLNGFIETTEQGDKITRIKIKPGKLIKVQKLTQRKLKQLLALRHKICFAGERVFNDIKLEYTAVIDIIQTNDSLGLLLRPVQEFNVSKSYLQTETSTNLAHVEFKNSKSNYPRLTVMTTNPGYTRLNLIDNAIWMKSPEKVSKINLKISIKVLLKTKFTNSSTLGFIRENIVDLPYLFTKRYFTKQLQFHSLVQENQYVFKHTILGKILTTINKNSELQGIKKRKDKLSQMLLFSKQDYAIYPNRDNFIYYKKGDFIKAGDKLSPQIKVAYSGKITEITNKLITIHKATPIFLAGNTEFYKKEGSFIREKDLLGTISFKQIITGDIIQGLPKIEEILEARKKKVPALLASKPGIITRLNKKEIKVLGNGGGYTDDIMEPTPKPTAFLETGDVYDLVKLKNKNRIIVKQNDYIYLGQPLTEGPIDLHSLLETYFKCYDGMYNSYQAAYLSFKQVQSILIRDIQQIYQTQGVEIGDKHLEIIVKRMTSKVIIEKSGRSSLLPGELIELKQVNEINKVLDFYNYELVTYQPKLLGITRASLSANSFISAASFQETTRVLTAAAIEGKVDWLTGLKENVIIGRLIPAGTGFQNNQKS
nr:RNA polymerase b''-subunit [Meringosphaera mediterranea]